jgi:hypothetical protein
MAAAGFLFILRGAAKNAANDDADIFSMYVSRGELGVA